MRFNSGNNIAFRTNIRGTLVVIVVMGVEDSKKNGEEGYADQRQAVYVGLTPVS